jgi:hypothetical protein
MLNQVNVNVNSRKHEGEVKNLAERSQLQYVLHDHIVFFWGFSRSNLLFTSVKDHAESHNA